MDIVTCADFCYRELDSPDDIGIPNIVFWLTANLAQLNLLCGTDYKLDDKNQPNPELTDSEGTILKYLYLVHYYNRLIKLNLGAAKYDWSELVEGDTQIRRVSNNEIAKTYVQTKNALQDRLDKLVLAYNQNQIVPVSLSAAHDLIRFYRI